MKINKFKVPLLQAAAILAGVIIVFIFLASGGIKTIFIGIATILWAIAKIILYAIGTIILVLFSIILVIVIYAAITTIVTSEKEYCRLHKLKEKAVVNIRGLKKYYKERYGPMKEKLKNIVAELAAKMPTCSRQELKKQFDKLEQFQTTVRKDIDDLTARVNNLESSCKPDPNSGIFTYIKKRVDRALFMLKVEEAVNLKLTYGEIDKYLTGNLPAKLDKIVKEHPALTKNYIRELKKQ